MIITVYDVLFEYLCGANMQKLYCSIRSKLVTLISLSSFAY